jgi:thiopeptide-type bacteriocin biosynthesis protein
MKDLKRKNKQEDKREGSGQGTGYRLLTELFLRAPFYSYMGFDLDRVPEVLADPFFRNALYLASPGFYRALELKDFDVDRLLPKERLSLNKYYNRMCFRPTPFGSFATFSLLQWSTCGQVVLAPDKEVKLRVLPDQQLLVQLNKEKGLAGADLLMVNPLLYRSGRDYRVIRSSVDGKGKFRFFVDGLEGEVFYNRLFRFLKKAVTAATVRDWIVGFAGCSREQAEEQLGALMEQQLLVSAAEGAVISRVPAVRRPAPGVLSAIWKPSPDRPLLVEALLASVAADLESGLLSESAPSTGQYFYGAAERPVLTGGPSFGDQQELEAAVRVLQGLALPAVPPALKNFIADFKAKFDRASVPLLVALDPDTGISYDNMTEGLSEQEVLKGIRFPVAEKDSKEMRWTAVHRLLFRVWKGDAVRDSYSPLQIRDADLEELWSASGSELFPPVTAVMFRKTEDHLHLEHAGEPHATTLVGRFSVFSEEVADLCRKLAGLEMAAYPDLIFADIHQLSDHHVDNVNRRRRIYPYEIPLNVYPSLPEQYQLKPEDLLLSVWNDELVLTSARLKKRVMPRLATAYNYRHNELGVFRLLCDLQYQGLTSGLNLELESLFPGLDFYPRVVYGQVILSLASWKFSGEQAGALAAAAIIGDALTVVREFRERYRLPQRISLGQEDKQLVFDLGNPPELGFFLECINGTGPVRIREYLLPGRSVKKGYEALAGQYIGFLHHQQPVFMPFTGKPVKQIPEVTRDHSLGSDWLYLKIYCTPVSADRILTEVIGPVCKRFRALIRHWFFIRYTERGYHLRIRINLLAEESGRVLTAIAGRMRTAKLAHLVRDLQGDTYRRELERYRPEIIEQVEAVFAKGSQVVLQQLRDRAAGRQDRDEFGLAFLSVMQMAAAYLNDQERMIAFFNERVQSFFAEFGADKPMRLDLDSKYRQFRPLLEKLCRFVPDFEGTKQTGNALKILAGQLKDLALLTRPWSESESDHLLADLIHMQLNRTFPTEQRKQELLVCFCLYKQLCSLKARGAEQ